MLRIAVAAAFLAAFVTQADAAPNSDWKQIANALDGIPTAAGVTLKKRLANCHMTIRKEASWIETRAVAWPDYGAKPGQSVLKLVVDLPAAKVDAGSAPLNNLSAIWLIDHGKATPVSAWANVLQNRPVPLGYDAQKNC